MRLAWAVAAVFFARFATTAWFYQGRDADLGWQRWLGERILHDGRLPATLGHETFTASGAPWIPQEWLLSIGVALAAHFKVFGALACIMALCGVGAILISALSARRLGASPFSAALCSALLGMSMLQSFGVRAQIAAWLLLAIFLLILRTVDDRKRWLIVPCVALWANVHASAILAVVLLLAWTLGRFLDERSWTRAVRVDTLLTFACSAALCATPLGWRLPVYAIQLFASPIVAQIAEWQPAHFGTDESALLFGLLPLILAAFALQVRRPDWPAREKLLLLAALYLGLEAVRNIPNGALIVAPIVAAALGLAIPQRARVNTLLNERGPLALIALALAVAGILVPLRLLQVPEVTDTKLPFTALASLASTGAVRNVYCEDFAWCSLALRYPRLRVYLDGRCDPFPIGVWDGYTAIFYARRGWQQRAARGHVDTILVGNGHALATALSKDNRTWRLAYRDRRYSIFLLRSGSYALSAAAGTRGP